MDNKLKQDKTTVVAFYDLMFNQCRPAEAIDRYVGDVCILLVDLELLEAESDRAGPKKRGKSRK